MALLTTEHWEAVCREGDERAFAPFFEASKALVWTVCICTLGNEPDALDAFQSTYARLLVLARDRGAGGIDASLTPAKFVALIARREADALFKRRQRLRRREYSMDPHIPMAAPDPSPRENAAQNEQREKIRLLVLALPEPYRMPLMLHYLHGMTQEEVAGTLGRPRGTIAGQLKRGLRLLQPMFERAGLGETTTALGVLGGAALLAPHRALGAAEVYGNAKALMASSSFIAGAASAGFAANWVAWLTMIKLQLIAVGLGVLLVGSVAVWLLQNSKDRLHLVPAPSGKSAVANFDAMDLGRVVPLSDAIAPVSPLARAQAPVTNNAASSESESLTAPRPPSGPREKLEVAVLWADTQTALPGVDVVASHSNGNNDEWKEVQKTDAQGFATLLIPLAWGNDIALNVVNLDVLNVGDLEIIDLPHDDPLIPLFVSHAARVHGVAVAEIGHAPVPHALVSAIYIDASASIPQAVPLTEVMADADGKFEMGSIPGLTVQLVARTRNMVMNTTGGAMLVLYKGENQGPIEVVVPAPRTIAGVVTDAETGRPLSNATVTIPIRGRAPQQTDARGSYRFEDVDDRQYELTASHPGYADGKGSVDIKGTNEYTRNFVLSRTSPPRK